MSQLLVDPPEAASDGATVEALEHRLEQQARRRDGWTITIFVFSALALLAAVVAVGLGTRAIDESKTNSRAGAGAATGGGPATATVHLREFAIEPAEITLGTGGTLQMMNAGTMPHDLAVKGTSFATEMIRPGGEAELSLDGLAAGTYTVICTVPGHEQAGMVATLHVGGAKPGATPAGPSPTGVSPGATTDATIDFDAMPATGWHPFDPALQPAPGATVHDITFHASEVVLEVAPGVQQEMWTFNGQVPGPILRGHLGDVFNVTLVNDGKMGHSIDFHASKVAPNVAMRTLQPGESLVYQFRADYAGIWMYHCGTAPALHHIGNGMFGAVIIDPPGLPPVDHEYVMVQSEIYTGPEGQAGDLAKMQAVEPDAVVFNGYVNQYKFAPVRVEPGQRERVWVLDAGPSENSSFHIVGTIFDTVFKEGAYLVHPDATRGGAQALDLQPAQGGFVEFTLDDAGLYPMVTHKFANVGKGALGLFQAGDVEATAGH